VSDPSGVSPALDLAGRIVAHDLTGCRPGPLPAEPLGSAAWRDLLVVVRRQRVEGPLAFAIEAGRCAATDEQREEAFAAHRAVMALDLLLERELVELTGPFAAAGVPMRVLKGPASAHLDEFDPAWRAFGDLDLLVRVRPARSRNCSPLGAVAAATARPPASTGASRRASASRSNGTARSTSTARSPRGPSA
jgi:hypothetical protein